METYAIIVTAVLVAVKAVQVALHRRRQLEAQRLEEFRKELRREQDARNAIEPKRFI